MAFSGSGCRVDCALSSFVTLSGTLLSAKTFLMCCENSVRSLFQLIYCVVRGTKN